MALSYTTRLPLFYGTPPRLLNNSPVSSCLKRGNEERVPSPTSYSGTSSSLDLLERLTSSDEQKNRSIDRWPTIREQLQNLVKDVDVEGDFSIRLGKKNLNKVTGKYLTISQKRNIKRQAYLDVVSQRNDRAFFATIGGFVLLPPLLILGAAIATGYVQLLP